MTDKKDQAEAEAIQVDPVAELESLQVSDEDFKPGAEHVAEPVPEKPDIPTDKLLLMAISPVFDIFAPAWEVTKDEKQALAAAYGALLDKYFPDLDLGPEIGAIVITAMIIVPRIGKPRKIEEGDQGNGNQSEHKPH